MNSIKIEKVKNGYIVYTSSDESLDNIFKVDTHVFNGLYQLYQWLEDNFDYKND